MSEQVWKSFQPTVAQRRMKQSIMSSLDLTSSPDILSSVGRWFQSLADALNRSWSDAPALITLTPTHLRGSIQTRALGFAGDASRVATYMTSPHTTSDTKYRVTSRLNCFPSYGGIWQSGWAWESFAVPSLENCTWCGTTIRRMDPWVRPWVSPLMEVLKYVRTWSRE